jgi:hypothetical protein
LVQDAEPSPARSPTQKAPPAAILKRATPKLGILIRF